MRGALKELDMDRKTVTDDWLGRVTRSKKLEWPFGTKKLANPVMATMQRIKWNRVWNCTSGYALKERVKLRAKIAAHQNEGRFYGGAPKGKWKEDDGEKDSEGSGSPEGDLGS